MKKAIKIFLFLTCTGLAFTSWAGGSLHIVSLTDRQVEEEMQRKSFELERDFDNRDLHNQRAIDYDHDIPIDEHHLESEWEELEEALFYFLNSQTT